MMPLGLNTELFPVAVVKIGVSQLFLKLVAEITRWTSLRQMDPKVLKCNKTSDQQNPGSQSIQLTDDDAILAPERLLVTSLTTGRTTRRWTFPVNEVAGVHRISNEELREVPSTVGKPGQKFSSALFSWNSRTVSLLDTNQIFEGIPEQIPS